MIMDKRKIFVTHSSMPLLEEYIEEIAPLWESHWLTNRGAKHLQLETDLLHYLGAKNISLFTNGHAALECLLEAMHLEGEIITTPFTFASTTHAIVRRGLTPVFADINRDDYTIDPASVESLVTSRTCAIMPVHVYGNLCDTEAIGRIADRYGLKVIYDAAHAFGVKRNGVPVSEFGDASMFSFHATKVFNTIEGGAVVYSDAALSDMLERCKNFGLADSETVDFVGTNAKMNEFSAAMGLCNLRHVDSEIAKRRLVVERYNERLSRVEGVRLCSIPMGVKHNYAYMPIVIEDQFGISRDDLASALANEGIFARKYFFPLITDFDCYRESYDSRATPIARDISSRVLTLPLYADLNLSDVDVICDVISACSR